MAARPAHHAGHRHRDNHSLHLARQTARHASPAACVLPVASRHYFCVHIAGYADEEDLCVEVRGVAVGVEAEEEDIARRRRGTEDTEGLKKGD